MICNISFVCVIIFNIFAFVNYYIWYMKLSSEIRILLLTLLANDEIVSSWGVTDIDISFSSLSFNVNGFLYTGRVVITPDSLGSYSVKLATKTLGNIDLNRIVQMLDLEIEKSEDYIDNLTLWIKKADL